MRLDPVNIKSSKFLEIDFRTGNKGLILTAISRQDFYNNRKILRRLKITHKDPKQNPGLEIADFIAGVIFRHYERGLTDFHDTIKPKPGYGDRKCFKSTSSYSIRFSI